jgi:DnaJ-domain-containing protein 1
MFLAYDYNPKWDGKVDIPENLKPWVKSKREQNAFIEGQANERERINKLNTILIENNRYDDLKRSTTDVEFQSQLLAELVPNEEKR